jgi:formylglycine-generating enzyme required for sulfatase activity
MAGNVYDWCWDWFAGDYYANRTDPTGSATGIYRLLRGGCWNDFALDARCSDRSIAGPGNDGSSFGFRPARGRP